MVRRRGARAPVALAIIVICSFGAAEVSAQQAQVRADAEALEQWSQRMSALPSSVLYRPSPADDADRIKAKLQTAAQAAQLAAQAAPFVRTFAQRYGEDESAIARAFRGVHPAPAQRFYDLKRRVERYQSELPQMAGVCLDLVMEETDPQTLSRLQPLFRERSLAASRELLQSCESFAGTGREHAARIREARQRVGALAGQVQAHQEAEAQAELERLRARDWPSHTRVRPGNARQLASQAFRYLRSHADWGRKDGYTLRAIAVTQDWQVHRRDLRGRPIEWKLGFRLALSRPDTPEGQVDTVDVSLTTHGRQRPPFHDVLVGGWSRILREKLP